MKAVNYRSYNKGKLRGFFDLEIPLENNQHIVIKGFKIMEGINGIFASLPSQLKDGEYYDTIFCTKYVRQELSKIAQDLADGVDQDLNYDQSGTFDPETSKSNDDEEIPF